MVYGSTSFQTHGDKNTKSFFRKNVLCVNYDKSRLD